MSLEEKLKKFNITKLLVVDDTKENIEAAKEYFSKLNDILKVDYATGTQEAIELIQKSYNEGESYSLVLSDLTMEERYSGLNVVREAMGYAIPNYIVTGINYDYNGGTGHGPKTNILPQGGDVDGRKSEPGIWEELFKKVIWSLGSTDELNGTNSIYESLNRFRKYAMSNNNKKPPFEELKKIADELYSNVRR